MIRVKLNSTWKDVKDAYVKVDGVWKKAKTFLKAADQWSDVSKEVFLYVLTRYSPTSTNYVLRKFSQDGEEITSVILQDLISVGHNHNLRFNPITRQIIGSGGRYLWKLDEDLNLLHSRDSGSSTSITSIHFSRDGQRIYVRTSNLTMRDINDLLPMVTSSHSKKISHMDAISDGTGYDAYYFTLDNGYVADMDLITLYGRGSSFRIADYGMYSFWADAEANLVIQNNQRIDKRRSDTKEMLWSTGNNYGTTSFTIDKDFIYVIQLAKTTLLYKLDLETGSQVASNEIEGLVSSTYGGLPVICDDKYFYTWLSNPGRLFVFDKERLELVREQTFGTEILTYLCTTLGYLGTHPEEW